MGIDEEENEIYHQFNETFGNYDASEENDNSEYQNKMKYKILTFFPFVFLGFGVAMDLEALIFSIFFMFSIFSFFIIIFLKIKNEK